MHAFIAVLLLLLAGIATHSFLFFGWLTAYYTRPELVREASFRANLWFAVLVISIAAIILDVWAWRRSRRKVG